MCEWGTTTQVRVKIPANLSVHPHACGENAALAALELIEIVKGKAKIAYRSHEYGMEADE